MIVHHRPEIKLERPTRNDGETEDAFMSRVSRWIEGHRFDLELERIGKETSHLVALPAEERRALVRVYGHSLGVRR
jgi:hypothetical protein